MALAQPTILFSITVSCMGRLAKSVALCAKVALGVILHILALSVNMAFAAG